jgi:aminopeptidase N
MGRSISLLVLVAALALAACASESEPVTSSLPGTVTSTTLAATTTSTTATPSPAAFTGSATPVADRLGLGDSRYPELGNGGYDVRHYEIDLTFDPEPNTANALVQIQATATEPLSAFSLDFVGFEVLDVKVDGAPAAFERAQGELIVQAPTEIAPGQDFDTAVTYSGTPAPVLSQALPFEVGWRTDPDGTAYVVAEPDGGRSWLPLNDHPTDKATFTFRITVPEPLLAAANGTLVERITDLGWSTWVWASEHPMASYLATVVIGPLEIVADETSTAVSGVAVRNVLPSDLAAAPPAALGLQGEMIEFFAGLFGTYPFETYGIAVVDGFEAALENQTLSIFGRTFVDDSQFFETVLVHELAHQWFGNAVTPADWGDVWLNEGFATYAEWLWVEHTRGVAAFESTVTGARNQMALAVDLAPPGNPPADDLFNASVYVRGGLVLHALRSTIGDADFFATLQTHAAVHRYANASTGDFIAIAESVSGEDLSGLFDDWLFGKDVPELP